MFIPNIMYCNTFTKGLPSIIIIVSVQIRKTYPNPYWFFAPNKLQKDAKLTQKSQAVKNSVALKSLPEKV